MEGSLFEEIAEAVRTLLPPDLPSPGVRAHRYGMKLWFGGDKPTREHYEAQVIGARYVPGASVLGIEVGFHAEHPREADNEAVLARLVKVERRWRKTLGGAAEAGAFLGRAEWRRLSETWPDPDLGDDGLVLELASRLTDYVTVLEPLLVKE